LVGRLGAHHGAVAATIAAHVDLPDANIAALEQEVAASWAPFGPSSGKRRPSLGWPWAGRGLRGRDRRRYVPLPEPGPLAPGPANKEAASDRRPEGPAGVRSL
jgi:hypothetical protein